MRCRALSVLVTTWPSGCAFGEGNHSDDFNCVVLIVDPQKKYEARFAGTAEQVRKFIAASTLQKPADATAEEDEWEWISDR